MKLNTLAFSLVSAVALTASSAFATPSFVITEAWIGLPGQDGTADWIEVTNAGTSAGDTGTIFYDDSSPTLANAGQLDSFILAPGESAIFLEDSDPINDVDFATSVEEFLAIWGSGITVGLTNGGGALGQGGDQANLLDAQGGILSSLDTFPITPPLNGFETVAADINGTPLGFSQLGVQGAYVSNSFFNDNADVGGVAGSQITLIGSPGLTSSANVPEPTTIVLLMAGLMGAAGTRSRK